MTTHELIRDLAARGVALSADGDRLNIDAPGALLTDELLATIKERKAELLELLVAERCPICGDGVEGQNGEHYRHIWCPTPGHFDSWRTLGGRGFKETDAPIHAHMKAETSEGGEEVVGW